MLAVIAFCSLGTHLTIAGHTTLPLPWASSATSRCFAT